MKKVRANKEDHEIEQEDEMVGIWKYGVRVSENRTKRPSK